MQTNKVPENPIDKPKKGILGWVIHPVLTFFSALGDIFWGIASIFGIRRPLPTTQHEYIDSSDVDLELAKARDLASGHDIVDGLEPADVVLRYAAASPDNRATIDLSSLDDGQQDWLAGLSDRDLYMIAMTGRRSAERSLEHRALVLSFPKSERVVNEPEVLPIPEPETEAGRPTKGDLQIIRENFRSALTGTGRPYDYRPQ